MPSSFTSARSCYARGLSSSSAASSTISSRIAATRGVSEGAPAGMTTRTSPAPSRDRDRRVDEVGGDCADADSGTRARAGLNHRSGLPSSRGHLPQRTSPISPPCSAHLPDPSPWLPDRRPPPSGRAAGLRASESGARASRRGASSSSGAVLGEARAAEANSSSRAHPGGGVVRGWPDVRRKSPRRGIGVNSTRTLVDALSLMDTLR
jgi:hypothetical protein